jgi:hypothetical protein
MAVDYTLRADTLNRVKGATQATADMKRGSHWVDAAEDFQEAAEAKQQYSDIATMAWEEGFASMGDRGAWASGDLFDQFQHMEGGYKETYLEMVRQGDKMGAARMLKDQQTRSNSLQSWKDTMETAKEIHDGVGWSETLSIDDKHILGSLASQKGVRVVMDENNEMSFEVTMPNNEVRRVTRREIDSMMETGISPKTMRVEQVDRVAATEEYAKEGRTWEEVENQYTMQNEERVSEENYERWMVDNIAGGKFIEHMKEHPTFKAKMYLSLAGPDEEMGTADDIVTLTDNDVTSVLEAMRGNYEIAKPYIVEWLTLKDKSVYDGQQKRDKDAFDKERESEILRASKASLRAMGYSTEEAEFD